MLDFFLCGKEEKKIMIFSFFFFILFILHLYCVGFLVVQFSFLKKAELRIKTNKDESNDGEPNNKKKRIYTHLAIIIAGN